MNLTTMARGSAWPILTLCLIACGTPKQDFGAGGGGSTGTLGGGAALGGGEGGGGGGSGGGSASVGGGPSLCAIDHTDQCAPGDECLLTDGDNLQSGHCFTVACNLVDQPCGSGRKCTFTASASGDSETLGCVPVAFGLAEGASCDPTADACAAGLICATASDGNSGCYRFCQPGVTDCGSGRVCDIALTISGVTEVPFLCEPPDLCAAVSCSQPPAAACLNNDTLRTYAAGTCDFGVCSYDYEDVVCNNGCSGGACALTCVGGTQTDCTAVGLHWNGTQCCWPSSQTLVCTSGDAPDCQGTKFHWTGTQCCLDSPHIEPLQCVPGTAGGCHALTGALWTGDMCCVGKAEACSPWTPGQCLNSNGYWTGVDCCLPP